MVLSSNSIVLIGSISAIVMLCTVATVALVAVIVYKKGEHLVFILQFQNCYMYIY